jgi:poly-gamma-glutamate capsule biosynthesis protein CapA/YwtB (metallophosphatase superfamily)
MSASTGLTLAFAGNTYLPNPVSVHDEPSFLEMVQLLRSVDLAVVNVECVIHEGENWPAYWAGMAWDGTPLTYMAALPIMVDELKFMGFGAATAANNHVGDFGEGGILSTIGNFRRGGMAYAGIGASLSEASQPCYVETRHGRVALISAADWGPRREMGIPAPWPAGYMPADEGPPFRSRPGINLLRFGTAFTVNRPAFDQLRAISEALGWEPWKAKRRAGMDRGVPLMGTMQAWEVDTETEFFFMGRKFVLGEEFGVFTFPFEEDTERLYRQIREARRQADVVVVALHDQSRDGDHHDYISTFAHGVIDAGADIYLNNGGPHRGIEVYKGKAILHGQSTFYLQNDQITSVPASMMRRAGLGPNHTAADFLQTRKEDSGPDAGTASVTVQGCGIHIVEFDERWRVTEVRLYPIWHGEGFTSGGRKGVPRLATPGSEAFEKVIRRTVERSKPYGTQVAILEDRAVVRIASGHPAAGERDTTTKQEGATS